MELKHVQLFVIGACQQREAQSPGFCDDLTRFTQATVEVVWAYLQGRKTLDGSCSDFDCWLAHEAAKVFGWPEKRTNTLYELRVHDKPDLPPVWVVARDQAQIAEALDFLAPTQMARLAVAATSLESMSPGVDFNLPQEHDELRAVLSFLLNS